MTVSPAPALERVTVVSNERLAEGVGLIVLHAPRCAASVLPGQFVHLRVAKGADIILRRPFSVHRVQGDRIEILYQVLGAGTLRLAEKEPGDASMDIVGPLGTGWSVPDGTAHALLVTGGLGAAPLGMLAEALAERGVAAVVAMGAPSEERLVARDLFERVARRVEVATDDGSAGEAGFVTALSQRLLSSETFDVVYTCGPEAMQRIVAAQAAERRRRLPGLAGATHGLRNRGMPVVRGEHGRWRTSVRAWTVPSSTPGRWSGMRRRFLPGTRPSAAGQSRYRGVRT